MLAAKVEITLGIGSRHAGCEEGRVWGHVGFDSAKRTERGREGEGGSGPGHVDSDASDAARLASALLTTVTLQPFSPERLKVSLGGLPTPMLVRPAEPRVPAMTMAFARSGIRISAPSLKRETTFVMSICTLIETDRGPSSRSSVWNALACSVFYPRNLTPKTCSA